MITIDVWFSHNQIVETKWTEDETSGGPTTHQGSFLNLLPTQIEDPEKEGSKSSSSGWFNTFAQPEPETLFLYNLCVVDFVESLLCFSKRLLKVWVNNGGFNKVQSLRWKRRLSLRRKMDLFNCFQHRKVKVNILLGTGLFIYFHRESFGIWFNFFFWLIKTWLYY